MRQLLSVGGDEREDYDNDEDEVDDDGDGDDFENNDERR